MSKFPSIPRTADTREMGGEITWEGEGEISCAFYGYDRVEYGYGYVTVESGRTYFDPPKVIRKRRP
jgi:hypothetical protein